MCNEVITLVPKRSPRHRITRFLFSLVALPIVGICLYAFASGQIQAFRLVQQPKLVVSSPVQHRQQKLAVAKQQPAATPKVAKEASQRQLRRGFKVGYAVARLEQAMEGAQSSK